MNDIGKRIRYRREQLGLTQQDLADRVNATQPQIGRYETGIFNPRLDKFVEIVRALHTTPNWLLGYEEVKEEARAGK